MTSTRGGQPAEPGAAPSAVGGVAPSGGGGEVEREFTVKARTQTQMVVRRFLRHKAAVISLVVFVLIVLFAFIGGALWHHKVGEKLVDPDYSASPSWAHPMGTTNTGEDNMALVLKGTQRSVEIALFVAITSTIVGAIYGAIAGLYRGGTDSVMMRFVDVMLTFPIIAVAAVLSYNFNATSWLWIAVIISVLTWPYVSRIVRGVTLSLREKEFIEAARAIGSSDSRIIFRHLLPNAMGPIIVTVTILVATAILTETALSFIGFGVQFPDTSLGLLVSGAQTAVKTRPWLFYFPGVFIILIALSVNFIGDGLRDAFDPTQTRVRA
jgi:peptide/nickel transport system permease protein